MEPPVFFLISPLGQFELFGFGFDDYFEPFHGIIQSTGASVFIFDISVIVFSEEEFSQLNPLFDYFFTLGNRVIG